MPVSAVKSAADERNTRRLCLAQIFHVAGTNRITSITFFKQGSKHILAVAVFEIQIKLVVREELKKLFPVRSIITLSRTVPLLEFGGEILVVHAFTQNVDFKPSIKELSNLKALE